MMEALGSVQVPATPFLLGILLVFTACVLILAIAVLRDSDAETFLVRAFHRARLGHSRMGRMLRRRQVATGAYARSLSVVEMKEQIEICTGCGLTDLCDRALQARLLGSRSTFSFCPNRPAIERFLLPPVRVSRSRYSA